MSSGGEGPLETKIRLETADSILKFIAAWMASDDSTDETILIDIQNAVADYADKYWPDGPRLKKLTDSQ